MSESSCKGMVYTITPTFIVRYDLWKEDTTAAKLLKEVFDKGLEIRCKVAVGARYDFTSLLDISSAVSGNLLNVSTLQAMVIATSRLSRRRRLEEKVNKYTCRMARTSALCRMLPSTMRSKAQHALIARACGDTITRRDAYILVTMLLWKLRSTEHVFVLAQLAWESAVA